MPNAKPIAAKSKDCSGAWLIAWDSLFALLILFPLLTGGVWLRRPGLFLEHSNLGVPVLLITILSAVLRLAFRVPLENAFFFRLLSSAWEVWGRFLARRPVLGMLAPVLLFGALGALASLRRHWALGSGAYDLGLYANALWNLSHGNGYFSSIVGGGVNLLADHQHPLYLLLTPIYALAGVPETLLVIQAFALASAGWAVHALARQYLPEGRGPEGHWGARLLPLAYWLYLPLRNANTFDFHPETLMLPLFLGGIAGIQSLTTGRRVLGALALLLALGAKESAGPVGVGVGLAWLLGAAPGQARAFSRKAGLALIVAGVAAFYIDTRLVPGWVGREYTYGRLYEKYGTGILDLVLSPFVKPEVFWPAVLGKVRLKYLFLTLAPLGFLPLLGWRAAIAAVPGYLMLFMGEGDSRINITFHYAVEPSVGLFWAVAPGLAFAVRRFGDATGPALSAVPRVALWLLFWSFGLMGRSDLYKIRSFTPDEHARWLTSRAIPCLSDAPVAAPNALAAQLSSRWWISQSPVIAMPGATTASCVIEDPAVNNWPMDGARMEKLSEELRGLGYKERYRCGAFRVLELPGNAGPGGCLKCEPECPR